MDRTAHRLTLSADTAAADGTDRVDETQRLGRDELDRTVDTSIERWKDLLERLAK